MALSFSLAGSLPKKGRQGSFDFTEYWHRSLVCAIAARSLARLVKSPHGDEAFRRYCHHQETTSESELIAEFGLARQALHAAAITFPHPVSGAPFSVECPLAADMNRSHRYDGPW